MGLPALFDTERPLIVSHVPFLSPLTFPMMASKLLYTVNEDRVWMNALDLNGPGL